jgi:hypothetical protein
MRYEKFNGSFTTLARKALEEPMTDQDMPPNGPYASDPYRASAPAPWPDALTVPYAGQARMTLGIRGGLANARIRIDPDARYLLRVDPGFGEPPLVSASDDEIRVDLARPRGWWRLFTGDVDAPLFVIHPTVAWRIVVHGGIANVCAELAAGALAGFEVSGGASDVDLDLPRPAKAAPIWIRGGASRLRVRRPADVAVAVAVRGGIASLRLDDSYFDAIGGGSRLCAGHLDAAPHYDLAVSGGASELEVARR